MIKYHLQVFLITLIVVTFLRVHSVAEAGDVTSSVLAFVPNMTPSYKTTAKISNSMVSTSCTFQRLSGVPVRMELIHRGDLSHHRRANAAPNENQDGAMMLVKTKNNLRDKIESWLKKLVSIPPLSSLSVTFDKPPPMQIDDFSLLFYDIVLILNLSVSISFWVVHRLSFIDILPAFSEGSLLCILWIIAGLWNGAFLYSAVDGHYDPRQQGNGKNEEVKGGPTYAALLGLSTFVTTANLRVIIALVTAVVEHRKVGANYGEDLIPLEIACGLILMACWRMLHSSFTPRG